MYPRGILKTMGRGTLKQSACMELNGVLLPLDDLAGVRRTIVPSGLLALIVLDLGMTSGVGGRGGGVG